jgi:hypothetical protein
VYGLAVQANNGEPTTRQIQAFLTAAMTHWPAQSRRASAGRHPPLFTEHAALEIADGASAPP